MHSTTFEISIRLEWKAHEAAQLPEVPTKPSNFPLIRRWHWSKYENHCSKLTRPQNELIDIYQQMSRSWETNKGHACKNKNWLPRNGRMWSKLHQRDTIANTAAITSHSSAIAKCERNALESLAKYRALGDDTHEAADRALAEFNAAKAQFDAEMMKYSRIETLKAIDVYTGTQIVVNDVVVG